MCKTTNKQTPACRGPGYRVLFDTKEEQSPCPALFSYSLSLSPVPHSGGPTFPSSPRCLGWLGRMLCWLLLCHCLQVPVSSIPGGLWHSSPSVSWISRVFHFPTLLQPRSLLLSRVPSLFMGQFFLWSLLLSYSFLDSLVPQFPQSKLFMCRSTLCDQSAKWWFCLISHY